ncbi:MAG TPA: hypothetical protein VKZ65_09805 [Glycomyces sp.]|nr:hypothetical protein [Glycomyces sp.]
MATAQLNHRGTLFGGAAIAFMDRAAFVAASRRALETWNTEAPQGETE